MEDDCGWGQGLSWAVESNGGGGGVGVRTGKGWKGSKQKVSEQKRDVHKAEL
jgi:hypothetical protein